MGIDLGNLAALRTFRVLRALKTVAIVPGTTNNPSKKCANFLNHRVENYRRSCHRIREESSGCDHLDHVFIISFCVNGFANLHGRFDAKMHSSVS